MSVKSLIDRIEPYAEGWTRTGSRSLLTLCEEAQDKLLDYDSSYNVFIGTGNEGFPPYLQTTTGTYRYSINGTTLAEAITKTIAGTAYTLRCRRVNRIFLDVSRSGYDYTRHWLGEPYAYNFRNPFSNDTTRLNVANIPITSFPALENTEAYIEFKEDPGTTTDRYFCEFVWEAPRLTAETIPLVIPSEYEAAIEDYVLGKISDFENGDTSAKTAKFENYWMPRFKDKITDGVQTQTNEVVPEFC